jgi:AraC family transcriptional regulator
MHLEMLTTKAAPQYSASCPLLKAPHAHSNPDECGLCAEKACRCLAGNDEQLPTESDIVVSRWVDPQSDFCHYKTASWSDRHVICIALKTTRLKLTRGSYTVFDGIMPAGTVHITGPSQSLSAEFHGPYDFIHFHVASNYLRILQDPSRSASQPLPDLNDLIVHDPLAELLCRTLVKSASVCDRLYVETVGHTLVMHVARLERPQAKVNVLPKWRLKRVREYIDAHLDERPRLADLATVAGLSRTHFAAQFRAATGYKPHDYLLYQRIEKSKVLLSSTDMPLAELALTVGFNAQAHFSTVFKHITGETPARWRRTVLSERQSSRTLGMPRSNTVSACAELTVLNPS